MPDILDDIVARLTHVFDGRIDTGDLQAVIDEVRREWAGDRAYIRGVGTKQRDAMLLADLADGRSVAFCARKYGITHRRVRQIRAEKAGGKK